MDKYLQKLHDEANNLAVRGNFKKAIEVNKQILRRYPDDVDSTLKLAYAQLQTSQYPQAKSTYRRVLKLEPTNQIARNNLEKILILEKNKTGNKTKAKSGDGISDPNLFLNIVGKTKEVSLANIGQADVLASLEVGEKVVLKLKKRRMEVRTISGEYVGALPDDISRRLTYFIEAGSEYLVFIKSASKNNVDIFIKEDKKGRRVRNFASFPKNIQDDLKLISGDEDNPDSESTATETDDNEEDTIDVAVDLDRLADEVEENESYSNLVKDDFADEDDE